MLQLRERFHRGRGADYVPWAVYNVKCLIILNSIAKPNVLEDTRISEKKTNKHDSAFRRSIKAHLLM